MSGNRTNPPSGGGRRATPKKPDGPTNRKAKVRTGRLRTIIKYGLISGVIGILMICAIFFFAYTKTTIPDPNAAFQTQATYVYYSNGKAKLGQFADQNRESIPLGKIPKSMQDAVVAAEDRTFWTNKGIDPKGILRAAFSNAKGNATQGASTITQQYVKILYLTQQRTVKRKIKEAFLSLKIQQEKSKQEILEGYLNTIYFGRGAYGVQAAANAYFGVDAGKLTVSQSAMLAAVLNSPSYLSPDGSAAGRAALLDRYDYVLDGMAKAGSIDASTIGAKLPKVVKERTGNQYEGQKGFMLTLVKNELEKLGFDEATIDGGGLRITTTFNRQVMDADKNAVAQDKPTGLKGLHVGVASVDVKTGGLLGFYGGQNFLSSQINYATRAAGSVGSSFKPFALAAGIKQGFSLKDSFQGNSPYTFPDGTTVKNEGEGTGENLGAHISLLYALQESVNTAFVDLTESMTNGPSAIKKMATAMDIPKTDDVQDNARIALGSASIAPVDMANSYSTIANAGVHHKWFTVSKVTRASDGAVLYKAPKKTNRVISSDIAADVSSAMQQVVKGGTGEKALALDRPAAGKTGTATNPDGDVDSSWFVGFTPQVSTAVMYIRGKGHESLEGFLDPYFGANYPTQTWTTAMQSILEGTDPLDFPPAANLDGTAPSSGHAPYVPPPPPPKKTPHKHKPKKTPTHGPTAPVSPPPSSAPPTNPVSPPPASPTDGSCTLLCPQN